MDELEALRQKKLQEMQNQALAQNQEIAQVEAQIQQLEQLARTVMDSEAMQRYGTLKTAHPEKAVQALLVLAQLVQSQRLKNLDDEGFKEILRQLDTGKKDFTITRK